MAAIVQFRDTGKLGTGFFDFPFEFVSLMLQLTNEMQQPPGERRVTIAEDDL